MAVQKSRPSGKSASKPFSSGKKTATVSQFKSKRPGGYQRPKKKTYNEKELAIPKLNMITPVGVQKPKGKKKGKVFVDDAESMLTIMAIVNADKEGQLESKMAKQRQLEEIRQARLKEQEAREGERNAALDEKKNSLRKSRKRKPEPVPEVPKVSRNTKRVSFAS